MLTKLRTKLTCLALAGTMWMAGHSGCDVGGIYDSFLGSSYPTSGYGGGYYGGYDDGYVDEYYVEESYYYEEEETWDPWGGYYWF